MMVEFFGNFIAQGATPKNRMSDVNSVGGDKCFAIGCKLVEIVIVIAQAMLFYAQLHCVGAMLRQYCAHLPYSVNTKCGSQKMRLKGFSDTMKRVLRFQGLPRSYVQFGTHQKGANYKSFRIMSNAAQIR